MLWKLLKQHISLAQLSGFFLANMCGMIIVLLSIQFYNDVSPVFTGGDSFMKNDYIIISKKVSTIGSLTGKSGTFSSSEIDKVKSQPFTSRTGAFQPAQFKVSAGVEFSGMNISTAMFFESVPDEFVDINSDNWKYEEGQTEIPIIIPRNYLNLYNFGFAQSRNLPQLSEGMMGMVTLNVYLSGNGKRDIMKGRIVGFSNRLNTILVPETFMNYANKVYGGNKEWEPSRLIIEVDNPADEQIAEFFSKNGYETENDKLDAGKTTWFLKMVVGIVMAVGLIISILSFYILMLSVYLLLQKNTKKLENLILIGYSKASVARPYQILTAVLNLSVLVLSFLIVYVVRGLYLDTLMSVLPGFEKGDIYMSFVIGVLLFLAVTVYNFVAIRKKINAIIN